MKRALLTLASLLVATVAFAQEKPVVEGISADFPYESHFVEVLGSKMHYIEQGQGDPIVFLHGNPTSSYLWRNIIPHVSGSGRCIAPDLIGMGKSDKPDIDYTFMDHVKYIEGFIDALGLKNITFVIHDWGSGIGFHYAMTHEDNVKAIAFMEAFVRPFNTWEDMPPAGQPIFKMMRTPDLGWNFVVKENGFVEQLLPFSVLRKLSDEEMDAYRAPYLEESTRKPLWMWPNEVPIGGEPAEAHAAMAAYSQKLTESELPKLMFEVRPGFLLHPANAAWCKENIKNLEVIDLGPGAHFVQEDYPDEIGKGIADWYSKLE